MKHSFEKMDSGGVLRIKDAWVCEECQMKVVCHPREGPHWYVINAKLPDTCERYTIESIMNN